MRWIGFILLFACVAVFGQLPDSADMRIDYFGIPSQNPDPDFVRTQTARINARDVYVNDRLDSLKDGTGLLIIDSLVTGGLYFSDTYYDDLRIPLVNTKINPLKSEPVFEDAGNGMWAFGFDADADSTEALNFIAQIPHSWKQGTDIECHIHWMPSTTNTGNVLWKMKTFVASIDSVFVAIDSFYITDAADGVAFGHQYLDMGDIPGDTIAGLSAIVGGWLSRVGDSDTYTGSAYGLEIDFHFEIDAPGSSEESVK